MANVSPYNNDKEYPIFENFNIESNKSNEITGRSMLDNYSKLNEKDDGITGRNRDYDDSDSKKNSNIPKVTDNLLVPEVTDSSLPVQEDSSSPEVSVSPEVSISPEVSPSPEVPVTKKKICPFRSLLIILLIIFIIIIFMN